MPVWEIIRNDGDTVGFVQAEDYFHADELVRLQYGSDHDYLIEEVRSELEDVRRQLENEIFDREVALRTLMEIM